MRIRNDLDDIALVVAYNNGTSAVSLAKKYNASTWAIITRLRKAGVEIRPDGVRKQLNLSSENQETFLEIVDGLLLGDGSISKKKPSLRIEQSEPRFGWLDDIAKRLSALNIKTGCTFIPPKQKIIDGRIISKTNSKVLYVQVCNEVREQRERWYQNDIKIVPADVRLTPLSIAYWLSGDGSYTTAGGLVFYTNSFNEYDVRRLANNLKNIGIETTCIPVSVKRPKEFKILISKRDSAQKLKELIEHYMPDCCKYKLQYVRYKLSTLSKQK